MTTLRISMLGPLQVMVDETPAAFRTDAERALLAHLAAHQGVPQRRDTLATLLSPDRSDKDALTYLRNRLTRLRTALRDKATTPPWFEVDRKQITLRAGDDIEIDVTRFERLLATVEGHAHRELAGCPTCLARLREAVVLVRGEFLAGLNFGSDVWESWLLGQREHLQQRGLEAMTWLRDAQMARNEWEAVLGIAQRQLDLEPWLEAAHRAAMRAHVQLGDRNAALAQYEQCERILWDELGVEPEEETRQLHERIVDSEFVVSGGADVPDNLPLQTGPFFGRQAEQAQLLERLVDPNYRLITLVGTGGMGKTRLAVEVGQQVKASFPDGVWFVALDAVKGGAEQIKIAVGEAALLTQDIKQLGGDQVQAILRDKHTLLILDNCESVLDELGFIGTWLNRAPELVILATSREPLNFGAESVVLLDGLPTGEGEMDDGGVVEAEMSAAEEMFAARGRMARDGFEVTDAELPHVRQICRLVDGSPLAIALAAAWVRRRSLSQIVSSIEESLDFLSTRQRDVEGRHRSMRAVFETSWQLLDVEEQEMLAALSVFPASFSAEAAEQVARATLFDLDLLCEKSLLQQQHEAERYAMHSLLRHFAAEKLAARGGDVDRALVDYFYRYACNHQDDYERLQPEWRNFSAALAKAHALEAWQTVLDFVGVLDEGWFRQVRFSEMRAGLALALESAQMLGDEDALAQTLLRLGEVELELNDYGVAEMHLMDALGQFMRLEEGVGIAQAKYLLGRIKNEQAQDDEALMLFEESRAIFEDEDDLLGIAKNLNLIAVSQIKRYGNFNVACTYLEQSVSLLRKLPASSAYVESLRNLAWIRGCSEAYVEADRCLVEASNVSRQQKDIGEYAAVLYVRVVLCKMTEQFDEALAFGYECLENFRQTGSLRWEALVKTQLGLLHQAKQDNDKGLLLLTEGLQIFCELGDIYEQAYSYYYISKLYAEVGKMEQSLDAKQRARRLNLELNDPQLQERLNKDSAANFS